MNLLTTCVTSMKSQKKLKFRLESNFQLNFSHGFNCEVERVKKKESPIFKQKDKLVKACLLNKVKILF